MYISQEAASDIVGTRGMPGNPIRSNGEVGCFFGGVETAFVHWLAETLARGVDTYTRESLAIDVGQSLKGQRCASPDDDCDRARCPHAALQGETLAELARRARQRAQTDETPKPEISTSDRY